MTRWLALLSLVFSLPPTAASAQEAQAQVVEVTQEAQVEVVTVGDGGDPTEPRILTVREPEREPGPAELIIYEARPPQPDVIVVHPLPLPEEHPYAHPVDEPVDDPTIAWFRWGLFVEELSLASLDLGFGSPEINALEGASVPLAEPWGSPIVGGLHFGSGARPLPWLRIPEVSLSIGGGSPDGAWVSPTGDADFEARLTSLLLLRAELAGGVELDLGPIRPFAMGRIGVAGYFVDADVRHAELGDLGTETLSTAAFETGFDVGVAIRVADDLHVTATWRETFGDARWRGGIIGISGGLGP